MMSHLLVHFLNTNNSRSWAGGRQEPGLGLLDGRVAVHEPSVLLPRVHASWKLAQVDPGFEHMHSYMGYL